MNFSGLQNYGPTREDYYKPRSDGGLFGWGMNWNQAKNAKTSDLVGRATFFTNPFNAATREDAMNSMGMLSKAQKVQVAKGGLFNKLTHSMIPGFTALGAGATFASGGDVTDFAADFLLPEIGLLGGWRAGKAWGQAFGSLNKGSMAARTGFGLAGGAVGALTGVGAALAVGQVMKGATDSNNFIKRMDDSITNNRLDKDFVMTQHTMTNRRRAAAQLSKSALNDRGQILGNEASIMRRDF